MFSNENQYFYEYLRCILRKKQMGHNYMSHVCKSMPKTISYFLILFHFKYILLLY